MLTCNRFTGAGAIAVDALQAKQPMPAPLKEATDAICQQAATQGTRIWVDAEQQVLQHTIDHWVIEFMKEYNQGYALILNTVQAYLKSARANIQRHLAQAAEEGWTLGIKLVRGAYIDSETRSLIHDTKEDSDISYNEIALSLVNRQIAPESGLGFPQTHLFLATHNLDSIRKVFRAHRKRIEAGQPTVSLECGQIQGMADHISCELLREREKLEHDDYEHAQKISPKVFKCLTWGTLSDCLGNLYRRAVENRDAVERTQDMAFMMRKELRRRLNPFSSWTAS